MKHTFLHLLGCLVPLLLIFMLPLFGVSTGVTLFAFIVLMFACHLLMMGGHGHGHSHSDPTHPDGDPHAHTER